MQIANQSRTDFRSRLIVQRETLIRLPLSRRVPYVVAIKELDSHRVVSTMSRRKINKHRLMETASGARLLKP